jgi:hypothetical protein
MLINYNFSRVFAPGADMVLNIQYLREMVEMLARIDLVYLTRARKMGRAVPTLYRSGVRYGRVDLWEDIPTFYESHIADCKNLTPALLAEKRLRGMQCAPAFRWVENADGSVDYHILVQEGTAFEDPSLILGMGKDEVARFYPAAPGV